MDPAQRARGLRLAPLLALGLCAGCSGDDADDRPDWAPAFDASSVGWLLNTWGPSADDLYSVGGEPAVSGEPGRGAIMHYDGNDWKPLDPGLETPLLNWAHGFGPDDIYVVGSEGFIMHYDGSEWTSQPTPTDQKLWGIWGASSDELWAVGGNGRSEGQATVLHYDGAEWTEVDLPELERPQVWAFFKVWGTAADDVWVVGQRGALLHWDGSNWQEHGAGTARDLISLWGTASDRIIAVGGRNNGVVARWDGEGWTSESYPRLPGFNGVWMNVPHEAYIVGVDGVVGVLDVDALELEAEFLDTSSALHNVFGDGDKLTAVGGNLSNTSGPFEGIAYGRPLTADE